MEAGTLWGVRTRTSFSVTCAGSTSFSAVAAPANAALTESSATAHR